MLLKKYCLLACISLIINVLSAQNKILFDATKAETAGNADWVIDADVFDIKWAATATLTGTEANAQRTPSPAQSMVTATTPETFWKGAISAWGIDCVKKGFIVESLPYTGRITFNDATNSQDLSNYKIFVVCEPNIAFTASEKMAIIAFVKAGGGLFMVGDHLVSDRNNDGKDSPVIWNELMNDNGSVVNPFGISFENNDIGNNNSNNLAVLPTNDPILYGTFGNVTQLAFHAGSSIAINKTANPTAHGVVYQSGVSNTGAMGMMCAAANYGKGKVIALGDSSVPDDGTGDTGDNLYNGYTGDAYASDNGRKLVMNATLWLATNGDVASSSADLQSSFSLKINPNIVSDVLTFNVFEANNTAVQIHVFNAFGTLIMSKKAEILRGGLDDILNVGNLPAGIYFLNAWNGKEQIVEKFIKN
jgi:Secretion system C-terminal sorting domain